MVPISACCAGAPWSHHFLLHVRGIIGSPVRRIGQRWRATRAPQRVAYAGQGHHGSAFALSNPAIARKAINSRGSGGQSPPWVIPEIPLLIRASVEDASSPSSGSNKQGMFCVKPKCETQHMGATSCYRKYNCPCLGRLPSGLRGVRSISSLELVRANTPQPPR